ncbi:MAG: Ig-like domain-containing protein [Acidobacteria bacterium]|nr:Ig-like domain-containing protein [Acidobacteriota bacterium]
MNDNKKAVLVALSVFLIVSVVGATWFYYRKTHVETEPIKKLISSKNKKGLQFRLSDGEAELPKRVPVVEAKPISDADAESILSRLEPIKSEESDKTEFALRENSLPPPKTGTIINTKFPPNKNLKVDESSKSGVLEVVRYSPQGDVPVAVNLSVTFSQPMVALTSQSEASQNVPVKISPQVEGKWRWLGTKTLVFEPKNRFPMSTEYSVDIDTTIKSALGQSLQTPTKWKFKTPTLTLKNHFPTGGSVGTDPVIFLEFDQEINKTTVLESIKVKSDKASYKVRLATKAEIEANKEIQYLVKSAKDKYSLAIKVDNGLVDKLISPLPNDTNITVSLEAGARSAEGTLKTPAKQEFGFTTYSPLQVTSHSCYEQRYACEPSGYVNLSFNNLLDPKSLDLSKTEITPKLEGMKMQVNGYYITITGKFKGKRVYKLKLQKGFIKDVFGQYLETPTTLDFYIGPSPKKLSSLGQYFLVLDPFGPAKLPVFTTNHKELRANLYAVQPEDFKEFVKVNSTLYDYEKETYRQTVGKLISSNIIKINSIDDEQIETSIDLGDVLQTSGGQVFVLIEPTDQPKEVWKRQYIRKWVQYTDIGLDAIVDNEEMLVWANSLKTGKALAGVEVSLRNQTATTGADGIARLKLDNLRNPAVLVGKKGKDTVILPPNNYGYIEEGIWTRVETENTLSWYVVDDRKTYRPGEKVTIKGWVRAFENKKGGDIKLAGEVKTVNYKLNDSQGNKISNGTTQVNPLGGFNLELTLTPTMNLGNANLEFQAVAPNSNYNYLQFYHNFEVQEFRRPEFEVSTKASENINIIGGHSNVTVSANYYSGGNLNNADVNWQVTQSPTTYTPPNRGDYTFGKWTPWWTTPSYSYYGRHGRYYADEEDREAINEGSSSEPETFPAKTNPNGTHNLRIDFDSVNPAQPTSLNVQATVMDVNRQAWSSSSTLLVHPSNLYVGLRSEKTFVDKGEPFLIKSIVTDIDGKAIANTNINLSLVRIEYEYDNDGRLKTKELDLQTQTITSVSDGIDVKFLPKEGGSYQLTATILDENARPNQTQLTLWVSGGKSLPERDLKQEQIQLIPDKKEYKVGETAQILVQAPFYPAEGLLTLRRLGVIKSERFTITSSTYTIKVPIDESYLPNLYVQVDLVGESERVKTDKGGEQDGSVDVLLPKRPAFAVGQLNLSIPPVSRTLIVDAKPKQSAVEPGGETVIELNLKDSNNKPVENGEVALFVVDEAILALSGYKMPNPIDTFYAQRSPSVSDTHLRSSVVLANNKDIETQLASNEQNIPADKQVLRMEEDLREKANRDMSGVAGGVEGGVIGGVVGDAAPPPPPMPVAEAPAQSARASKMEARKIADLPANGRGFTSELKAISVIEPKPDGKPIRVREDFNALAIFEAALSTDNKGHAEVKIKLPDSLTRYRIMAVAVAGEKQFGMGESTLTARMPLMVRPSAPRFLNFGDKFEFPIVVQNQTDAPLSVDVAMRATNATLTSGLGRRLTVPANERVEVRLPVSAEMAGKARFQIGVVSGKWTDAAQVSLPVWTPATTEAFATYGTFEEDAIIQPVKAPADIYKQFGGLEISTSSTQLQELTDAVLYIVSYPYECSEQVSSRVMAIAALKDVLGAFKAEGLPKAEELETALARDMKRLQSLQNNDGGFDYWRKDYESDPYLTVHVTHAIVRAKEKGFAVPENTLTRAQNYLRNIESYLYRPYYSQEIRDSIVSYSLYVRKLMGDKDINKAKQLVYQRKLEKLPIEAIGWLWSVLAGDPGSKQELEQIRQFIINKATETAATAHFVTDYKDGAYLLLASDYRTDAILLDALLTDQPSSDLIPKLVRGLLDHRKAGRWESTQENVFVLLALDRYFATYEKATPNFIARIWLGDKFAGEHAFKGRTTEKHQVNIPMNYLSDTEQNLTLSKEGVGRIYYRAGMRYAPKNLDLPAAEYGFTVERKYEAIDNPEDVKLDKDGIWRIKAGARVRVHLSMVAQARRYHVALIDPLPAGLEALNPALATTGAIPQNNSRASEESLKFGRYYWYGPWYQHQNFRDERVEAFTQLLWDGVYNYSYVARATTLGTFVVPPTKAEEMYHPETFGRSKTDKVVIY